MAGMSLVVEMPRRPAVVKLKVKKIQMYLFLLSYRMKIYLYAFVSILMAE